MSHSKISYTFGDESRISEATAGGWIGGIIVETADARRYELEFYDPTRLLQIIEHAFVKGEHSVALSNVVVVPTVSLENINAAVRELDDRDSYGTQFISTPSG